MNLSSIPGDNDTKVSDITKSQIISFLAASKYSDVILNAVGVPVTEANKTVVIMAAMFIFTHLYCWLVPSTPKPLGDPKL